MVLICDHLRRSAAKIFSQEQEMPTTATRPQLSYLTDQMNELRQKGTHFALRVLEEPQMPECVFDGKRVINLASNNYLGLTTHPKLREAALAATKKYGVG